MVYSSGIKYNFSSFKPQELKDLFKDLYDWERDPVNRLTDAYSSCNTPFAVKGLTD